MKRSLPLAFALCCTAAFAAMAINFSNLSATVDSNGLTVRFTATGVTGNVQTNFSGTADAKAVYGCFNRGGHNPNARNKQTTVTGHMRGTVNPTPNNSQVVNGSITIPVPQAGNFSCPNGQEKALSSVTYTNVVVTAVASGVQARVPGTFTKTFRPLN